MFTVDKDGPCVGWSDGEGVATGGCFICFLCAACCCSSLVGGVLKTGTCIGVAHLLVVRHGWVVGRVSVVGFRMWRFIKTWGGGVLR